MKKEYITYRMVIELIDGSVVHDAFTLPKDYSLDKGWPIMKRAVRVLYGKGALLCDAYPI